MAAGHVIEAAPIPPRYARGWHTLGLASQYKDGKPHTLDIFGTRLVCWQSTDGRLNVIDAYCVHMGADLSIGRVEGDHVVCPFHEWKFGPDGACKDIPYCKRIPPKARTRAWPLVEENHLLFIYHDPEGNPPPAEVAIPRIDACFSGEWTPWVVNQWLFNTHCRELVDNLADMAHFGPVHDAPVVYFANLFEGHKASQITVGTSRTLTEGGLVTHNTYFGPAYHITYMRGEMAGEPVESILLNSHVPRDLNSFHQRFGVMVKKRSGLTEAQNLAIAEAYAGMVFKAFAQDQAIWDTKKRVDNPLLCEGDGPIYQLREWYSQFYMNAADVPARLRERTLVETVKDVPAPPLHHVFED
jgi:3-ketosteroid 9alpha-monooxygenase subunit A